MLLYHDYYSWQCQITEHAIGHADGHVSIAFTWLGVNDHLFDANEHDQTLRTRLDLLKRISTHPGLTVEHHWFRRHDTCVIDRYIEHNQNIVRGHDLAVKIRREMAEHYRPLAMSNSVITVFTLSPTSGNTSLLNSLFRSKSQKKNLLWADLAAKLDSIFKEFETDYPAAKLLSADFPQYLFNSYHFDFDTLVSIDNRYDIAEQIISDKPVLTDDVLRMGERFFKAAIVQNNPTLEPSWMQNIASSNCDIHIAQTLVAKDALKMLNKSAEQSDTDELTASNKDRDVLAKGISDAQDYRTYITEHGLSVFDNSWIIIFSSANKETVRGTCRELVKWLGAGGGLVRHEADIQMHLYRVAQLCNGHHSQFSREDHSASVACMFPFTVFESGHKTPESLRMTSSYQCVGHSPSTLSVGHEFVVAQTGGGKDTQNGTEVMEVYPFGLDYYICEFGDSYRWIVEGFGGTYTTVDPDKTIINPMPLYADACDGRLPGQISLGTVEGLSIILLDESRELSQAEIAASERALNSLYVSSSDMFDSPTLPNLLDALESIDYINEAQQAAALVMYNNLYNFLDSSNGEAFKGQDNLQLSDGITGVDLVKIDKKMLKFYLTFISLRFAQKAFFNLDTISRIIFNELHEPVAVAPKVVERIVRTVNRMGRKEGSQMQLITQGMAEIQAIDPEILSSSPIRTMLARKDNWLEIGRVLDMPAKSVEIWSGYEQDIENLNYRQCMRLMNGQWNDLFLTFPTFALDITTTKREERLIKRDIESRFDNIFDRINEFQHIKKGANHV
ncbi:MAG: hypothetical protein GY820_43485 [Gammaproteobacteria bacterium]|nr:hypothetical protein [Gammaproteobacteria bacterium]